MHRCGCSSRCREASTRPSPPRCWSTAATTSSAARCGCGVGSRTPAAARQPTSTTRDAWPRSSTSTITCSTSPRSSRQAWSRRTSPRTRAGTTPNPCVACNRTIKFDALLGRATRLGFDALATGHHARVVRSGDRRSSCAGAPTRRRTRATCSASSAPPSSSGSSCRSASCAKDEVRALARALGLRTADKPDSQEVCFVPRGGRSTFLAAAHRAHAGRPWSIVESGAVLGTVPAVELVTVGQRRGLGRRRRRRAALRDVESTSPRASASRWRRAQGSTCRGSRSRRARSLGRAAAGAPGAAARPVLGARHHRRRDRCTAAPRPPSSSSARCGRSPRASWRSSTTPPTPTWCAARRPWREARARSHDRRGTAGRRAPRGAGSAQRGVLRRTTSRRSPTPTTTRSSSSCGDSRPSTLRSSPTGHRPSASAPRRARPSRRWSTASR